MTTPIEPASDDLQFETAEPAAVAGVNTAAQRCAKCGQPIVGEYYAVNRHAVCTACRDTLEPPLPGSPVTRALKAFGLGLGAGLAGALVWYVVRIATKTEIGLIAVLVGFLVGKAVRLGSGNRGGRGYQIMAVLLTYCCIAANYVPDLVQAVSKYNDGQPVDFLHHLPLMIAIIRLALELPFLGGAENILGLIIIGFALWEAWKFTRRIALPITGPYRLSPTMPTVDGTVVGGAI